MIRAWLLVILKCFSMCRCEATFSQPRRDDWKKGEHLLQTVLADRSSCADYCMWRNICVIKSPPSMSHLYCSLLSQVILIFSIIQFKPARYENYVFPSWAQGVGWVIALASIIWIPLGAIHTLWVLPGSFMQVMYIYHLHLICGHLHIDRAVHVYIICTFLLQKLKLSITPYALNEKSKMPYYERGGKGYPDIAVISTSISLPPTHTYFWQGFCTDTQCSCCHKQWQMIVEL